MCGVCVSPYIHPLVLEPKRCAKSILMKKMAIRISLLRARCFETWMTTSSK